MQTELKTVPDMFYMLDAKQGLGIIQQRHGEREGVGQTY